MGMIKISFGPVLCLAWRHLVEVFTGCNFRLYRCSLEMQPPYFEIKGKKLPGDLRSRAGDTPPGRYVVQLSAFVERTYDKRDRYEPVFAYRSGSLVVDARIILNKAKGAIGMMDLFLNPARWL